MAWTEVHFTLEANAQAIDVPSVNVVVGDSVTFFADPNHGARLCMTQATTSFLIPAPDVSVEIDAGGFVTFQFAAAAPGVYSVAVQWLHLPCLAVVDQPGGSSASLSIYWVAPPVPPPQPPPPPVIVFSGPDPGGPQT